MKQDTIAIDYCNNVSSYVVDRKPLANEIRKLSKVDNLRGAWSIARQWLVIAVMILLALGTLYHFTGSFNLLSSFATLTVGQRFIVIFVFFLAALVISTRQHAFGIIIHDATHYRVFDSRIINDIVTDLTCAFPINLSTELYRRQHLDHHRYTNTNKDPYWVQMNADPDWCWPKTQKESLIIFAKDIVGLNMPQWGKIVSHWSPWSHLFPSKEAPNILKNQERILFILFWLFVSVFLTITNSWLTFFLLWVVPQLTFLNVFVRMRSVAEHLVLESEHELNQTRHVDGTLLERLTISPLNINYHIAHHMFPSVPQYNLPELHKILMENKDYRTKAKILPTYLSLQSGFLSEAIRNH